MNKSTDTATITTDTAVEAVAWERAPRYPRRTVNRRVVCADGFKVSVQASSMHYANDSSGGEAPYWRDEPATYPYITFEIGNPSGDLTPTAVWDEYDGEGVWPWVPRGVVVDLLDAHGGATGWEEESA